MLTMTGVTQLAGSEVGVPVVVAWTVAVLAKAATVRIFSGVRELGILVIIT